MKHQTHSMKGAVMTILIVMSMISIGFFTGDVSTTGLAGEDNFNGNVNVREQLGAGSVGDYSYEVSQLNRVCAGDECAYTVDIVVGNSEILSNLRGKINNKGEEGYYQPLPAQTVRLNQNLDSTTEALIRSINRGNNDDEVYQEFRRNNIEFANALIELGLIQGTPGNYFVKSGKVAGTDVDTELVSLTVLKQDSVIATKEHEWFHAKFLNPAFDYTRNLNVVPDGENNNPVMIAANSLYDSLSSEQKREAQNFLQTRGYNLNPEDPEEYSYFINEWVANTLDESVASSGDRYDRAREFISGKSRDQLTSQDRENINLAIKDLNNDGVVQSYEQTLVNSFVTDDQIVANTFVMPENGNTLTLYTVGTRVTTHPPSDGTAYDTINAVYNNGEWEFELNGQTASLQSTDAFEDYWRIQNPTGQTQPFEPVVSEPEVVASFVQQRDGDGEWVDPNAQPAQGFVAPDSFASPGSATGSDVSVSELSAEELYSEYQSIASQSSLTLDDGARLIAIEEELFWIELWGVDPLEADYATQALDHIYAPEINGVPAYAQSVAAISPDTSIIAPLGPVGPSQAQPTVQLTQPVLAPSAPTPSSPAEPSVNLDAPPRPDLPAPQNSLPESTTYTWYQQHGGEADDGLWIPDGYDVASDQNLNDNYFSLADVGLTGMRRNQILTEFPQDTNSFFTPTTPFENPSLPQLSAQEIFDEYLYIVDSRHDGDFAEAYSDIDTWELVFPLLHELDQIESGEVSGNGIHARDSIDFILHGGSFPSFDNAPALSQASVAPPILPDLQVNGQSVSVERSVSSSGEVTYSVVDPASGDVYTALAGSQGSEQTVEAYTELSHWLGPHEHVTVAPLSPSQIAQLDQTQQTQYYSQQFGIYEGVDFVGDPVYAIEGFLVDESEYRQYETAIAVHGRTEAKSQLYQSYFSQYQFDNIDGTDLTQQMSLQVGFAEGADFNGNYLFYVEGEPVTENVFNNYRASVFSQGRTAAQQQYIAAQNSPSQQLRSAQEIYSEYIHLATYPAEPGMDALQFEDLESELEYIRLAGTPQQQFYASQALNSINDDLQSAPTFFELTQDFDTNTVHDEFGNSYVFNTQGLSVDYATTGAIRYQGEVVGSLSGPELTISDIDPEHQARFLSPVDTYVAPNIPTSAPPEVPLLPYQLAQLDQTEQTKIYSIQNGFAEGTDFVGDPVYFIEGLEVTQTTFTIYQQDIDDLGRDAAKAQFFQSFAQNQYDNVDGTSRAQRISLQTGYAQDADFFGNEIFYVEGEPVSEYVFNNYRSSVLNQGRATALHQYLVETSPILDPTFTGITDFNGNPVVRDGNRYYIADSQGHLTRLNGVNSLDDLDSIVGRTFVSAHLDDYADGTFAPIRNADERQIYVVSSAPAGNGVNPAHGSQILYSDGDVLATYNADVGMWGSYDSSGEFVADNNQNTLDNQWQAQEAVRIERETLQNPQFTGLTDFDGNPIVRDGDDFFFTDAQGNVELIEDVHSLQELEDNYFDAWLQDAIPGTYDAGISAETHSNTRVQLITLGEQGNGINPVHNAQVLHTDGSVLVTYDEGYGMWGSYDPSGEFVPDNEQDNWDRRWIATTSQWQPAQDADRGSWLNYPPGEGPGFDYWDSDENRLYYDSQGRVVARYNFQTNQYEVLTNPNTNTNQPTPNQQSSPILLSGYELTPEYSEWLAGREDTFDNRETFDSVYGGLYEAQQFQAGTTLSAEYSEWLNGRQDNQQMRDGFTSYSGGFYDFTQTSSPQPNRGTPDPSVQQLFAEHQQLSALQNPTAADQNRLEAIEANLLEIEIFSLDDNQVDYATQALDYIYAPNVNDYPSFADVTYQETGYVDPSTQFPIVVGSDGLLYYQSLDRQTIGGTVDINDRPLTVADLAAVEQGGRNDLIQRDYLYTWYDSTDATEEGIWLREGLDNPDPSRYTATYEVAFGSEIAEYYPDDIHADRIYLPSNELLPFGYRYTQEYQEYLDRGFDDDYFTRQAFLDESGGIAPTTEPIPQDEFVPAGFRFNRDYLDFLNDNLYNADTDESRQAFMDYYGYRNPNVDLFIEPELRTPTYTGKVDAITGTPVIQDGNRIYWLNEDGTYSLASDRADTFFETNANVLADDPTGEYRQGSVVQLSSPARVALGSIQPVIDFGSAPPVRPSPASPQFATAPSIVLMQDQAGKQFLYDSTDLEVDNWGFIWDNHRGIVVGEVTSGNIQSGSIPISALDADQQKYYLKDPQTNRFLFDLPTGQTQAGSANTPLANSLTVSPNQPASSTTPRVGDPRSIRPVAVDPDGNPDPNSHRAPNPSANLPDTAGYIDPLFTYSELDATQGPRSDLINSLEFNIGGETFSVKPGSFITLRDQDIVSGKETVKFMYGNDGKLYFAEDNGAIPATFADLSAALSNVDGDRVHSILINDKQIGGDMFDTWDWLDTATGVPKAPPVAVSFETSTIANYGSFESGMTYDAENDIYKRLGHEGYFIKHDDGTYWYSGDANTDNSPVVFVPGRTDHGTIDPASSGKWITAESYFREERAILQNNQRFAAQTAQTGLDLLAQANLADLADVGKTYVYIENGEHKQAEYVLDLESGKLNVKINPNGPINAQEYQALIDNGAKKLKIESRLVYSEKIKIVNKEIEGLEQTVLRLEGMVASGRDFGPDQPSAQQLLTKAKESLKETKKQKANLEAEIRSKAPASAQVERASPPGTDPDDPNLPKGALSPVGGDDPNLPQGSLSVVGGQALSAQQLADRIANAQTQDEANQLYLQLEDRAFSGDQEAALALIPHASNKELAGYISEANNEEVYNRMYLELEDRAFSGDQEAAIALLPYATDEELARYFEAADGDTRLYIYEELSFRELDGDTQASQLLDQIDQRYFQPQQTPQTSVVDLGKPFTHQGKTYKEGVITINGKPVTIIYERDANGNLRFIPKETFLNDPNAQWSSCGDCQERPAPKPKVSPQQQELNTLDAEAKALKKELAELYEKRKKTTDEEELKKLDKEIKEKAEMLQSKEDTLRNKQLEIIDGKLDIARKNLELAQKEVEDNPDSEEAKKRLAEAQKNIAALEKARQATDLSPAQKAARLQGDISRLRAEIREGKNDLSASEIEAKEKEIKQKIAELEKNSHFAAQTRKIVAYELTSKVLNLALQEFAFPYIDEYCKADFTSSEPTTPPTDTGNPGPGGPGGSTGPDGSTGPGGPGATDCQVSYFRQASREQLQTTGYSYDIYYALHACADGSRFSVTLKGPGVLDYVIVNNQAVFAGVDTTGSIEDDIQPLLYDRICLSVNNVEDCENIT